MLYATTAPAYCSQCPCLGVGAERNLLNHIAPTEMITCLSVANPVPVRSRIATIAIMAVFKARKDEAQGLVVGKTSLHGHVGRVQGWIGRVGKLTVVAVQVAFWSLC